MRLTEYICTIKVIGRHQAGFCSFFSFLNDNISAIKMLLYKIMRLKQYYMYVSTLFPCQVGVKQGNIFSHCYFKCVSLCDGLYYIIEVAVFLKRHLLLYADDTVILAKNPSDLQMSLNNMAEHCGNWKLT